MISAHSVFLQVISRLNVVKVRAKVNLFNKNYNNCSKLHTFALNQQLNQHFAMTNKKQKTELVIGTHDGMFHVDEMLACFMLQQLPKYADAKIIRSRDENILKECDIVVDVGAIFDVKQNRFDHHQKSFEHTLSTLRPELGDNWNIRLSSAGLIYTYFGEAVIKQVLNNKLGTTEVAEDLLRNVYRKVYENFIQEIDAIDNGVAMHNDEPLYKITTHLSARVANYNSTWNSLDSYNADKQFEEAKQIAGSELVDKICYYANVWWPARIIVENAIKNRLNVHESGEILELDQFCPWKDHLFELEKELDIVGVPKYVLVKNSENDYRVIGVPISPTSFLGRKFLHKEWRGLRKDDLVKISGIPDAHFVHATGFIGGSTSRGGSFKMALNSLNASN